MLLWRSLELWSASSALFSFWVVAHDLVWLPTQYFLEAPWLLLEFLLLSSWDIFICFAVCFIFCSSFLEIDQLWATFIWHTLFCYNVKLNTELFKWSFYSISQFCYCKAEELLSWARSVCSLACHADCCFLDPVPKFMVVLEPEKQYGTKFVIFFIVKSSDCSHKLLCSGTLNVAL